MSKKNKGTICREIMTTGVHVREASEGEVESRTIEGYAIVFGVQSVPLWEDDTEVMREIISPEAISEEFLDNQDILMVLFHDPQLALARSKKGEGTLTYEVDEVGVKFSFDAPRTVDGDKCLELVRAGVLDGCSFKFRCPYHDADYVTMEKGKAGDGRNEYVYTVRKMISVDDFTICANPAYPQTEVAARMRELRPVDAPETPTPPASLNDANEIDNYLNNI